MWIFKFFMFLFMNFNCSLQWNVIILFHLSYLDLILFKLFVLWLDFGLQHLNLLQELCLLQIKPLVKKLLFLSGGIKFIYYVFLDNLVLSQIELVWLIFRVVIAACVIAVLNRRSQFTNDKPRTIIRVQYWFYRATLHFQISLALTPIFSMFIILLFAFGDRLLQWDLLEYALFEVLVDCAHCHC